MMKNVDSLVIGNWWFEEEMKKGKFTRPREVSLFNHKAESYWLSCNCLKRQEFCLFTPKLEAEIDTLRDISLLGKVRGKMEQGATSRIIFEKYETWGKVWPLQNSYCEYRIIQPRIQNISRKLQNAASVEFGDGYSVVVMETLDVEIS